MADFHSIFKSSPTTKLIQVTEAPEEYSVEALKAAKLELAARDDVEEALAELIQQQEKDALRKSKAIKVESAIGQKLKSFWALINPLQSEKATGERRLKWLLIFFGGIAIYQMIKEIPFVYYSIRYESEYLDFAFAYNVLPMLILPIGTILLYKRNKTGWAILYAWSIVNFLSALVGAYYMWNYQPIRIPMMDDLIPRPSSIYLIIGAIAVSGIIFALLHPQVRKLTHVDKRTLIVWSIIGLAIPFWPLVL